MKMIRSNIFETNSSSTHALVFSNKEYEETKLVPSEFYWSVKQETILEDLEKLGFSMDFGRCPVSSEKVVIDSTLEKAFYLREALKYEPEDLQRYDKAIEEIGNSRVSSDSKLCFDSYSLLATKVNNFYITLDGSYEATNLAKELLDRDLLEKFIFNENSYITIGGDEYQGYYIKKVGYQYEYEQTKQFEERVKQIEQQDNLTVHLL